MNPTEMASGGAISAESVFDYPVMGFSALVTDISGIGLGDVSTEFVTVGADTWLQVRPVDEGGQRPAVPIDNELAQSNGLGLHLLDYQLFASDLQTIVDAKIDAMG